MKVVIVGGGFAGVKAALELSKQAQIEVTLISDKTDFQYYPALYSTATGHSHLESWVPLATVFEGKSRVTLVHDTMVGVNKKSKTVTCESGASYKYDRLILALGVVTTYFGIKGLDKYAYGIKSADEITRLKQHLHEEFKRQSPDSHFVVVGAGPTGVELSAAMGAYLQRLSKQYGVTDHAVKIDLVEASPRVLPRMSEAASQMVAWRLARLGVMVHTGTAVKAESAGQLTMGDMAIKSHTVIWTSGVTNHPFFKEHGDVFALAPNGRVTVDAYMSATDDIYVLGDNAATPFGGLAQTALHDAIFVARNLRREVTGQPPRRYNAVKPPTVVPVGPFWAIFEWHWLRLSGLPAAILRRAADFMGYHDVLPLGHALGAWRASRIYDDDEPKS